MIAGAACILLLTTGGSIIRLNSENSKTSVFIFFLLWLQESSQLQLALKYGSHLLPH